MATIIQRPNGRFQVKVRRDGITLSKTFKTKTDAAAWGRQQESAIERGAWMDLGDADRTTLAEALERYELEVTAKKRGADAEKAHIRALLATTTLGTKTLSRIRSNDLASVVHDWETRGYAPATINRRLLIVSHLYKVAARRWGMPGLVNPVQHVDRPKIRNARSRRVADGEIEAVVAAATRSRYLAPLATVGVETGIRLAEMLRSRWENVDLKRRVIHLPVEITKTGVARDVPLSTRAVAALKSLPRQISGVIWNAEPHNVSSAWGKATRRARVRYEADCAARGVAADPHWLVDLHFHDLRHEATSRLAEVLAAHELAKMLGHQDMRMTMRYYHPRAEDLAAKLG